MTPRVHVTVAQSSRSATMNRLIRAAAGRADGEKTAAAPLEGLDGGNGRQRQSRSASVVMSDLFRAARNAGHEIS